MNKKLIYKELVRQLDYGNKADDIINRKINCLLALVMIFISYFFTNDSFLNIFKQGNLFIKHLFGFALILLIISVIYTVKAFLLMKYRKGIKIDKINPIIKKHKKVSEIDVINFALDESIQYNYENQKIKNENFIKALVFISLAIFMFIIAKSIYFLTN
ncbi:MAG: hypothetical protein GF365_03830 [Candidatus Buchananbacteria bacterium]|nr:hypothetical protein [Candidatus Buchananbacteria bacterium]